MENNKINIPDKNAVWNKIQKYALSFNAYEYWDGFDKTAEIANKQLKEYKEKGTLPENPIIIKTCLFFEERRNHHAGTLPSDEAMKYIKALLEKIRSIEEVED